jgi:hypothetical protein
MWRDSMHLFAPSERKILAKLKTPRKIQDFLEGLRINFEETGETCLSPRRVLRERKAHCMEGAMLAAAALEFHGRPPLVLDLRAVATDFDHVIAVFESSGYFGAITKTNHAVLRYREPVYKTIRELVMSFFHEYFTDAGRKTLREYSLPVNLVRFRRLQWQIAEADLWEIPEYLDEVKHYPILNASQMRTLRLADAVEIAAGKIVEWKLVKGKTTKGIG